MTRIPIAVTEVSDAPHFGTLATSLLSIFVFGIILGAISSKGAMLMKPGSETIFLSGAGASDVKSDQSLPRDEVAKDTPWSERASTENESAAGVAETRILIPATSDESSDMIGEVRGTETTVSYEDILREQSATRLRLVNEIKLIKDTSVMLIAEFGQNCGVWTDVCAEPYQAQLEKNNKRYDELESRLALIPNFNI